MWENRAALEEFAKTARFENYSVPFLNILALKGRDQTSILDSAAPATGTAG